MNKLKEMINGASLAGAGIVMITLGILFLLAVIFGISALFTMAICWSFGITFMWKYVVGYMLISLSLANYN